jgi:hypothetical protein
VAPTQRGHAHADLAGVASVGRRHETRALLVPRQDQLDLLRTRQAVEHVEVLLARHAEDIFHAFLFQALDEQVRSLGRH